MDLSQIAGAGGITGAILVAVAVGYKLIRSRVKQSKCVADQGHIVIDLTTASAPATPQDKPAAV